MDAIKAAIIERYGQPWRFALAVNRPPAFISNVTCGRQRLSPQQAEEWAEKLGLDLERFRPFIKTKQVRRYDQ